MGSLFKAKSTAQSTNPRWLDNAGAQIYDFAKDSFFKNPNDGMKLDNIRERPQYEGQRVAGLSTDQQGASNIARNSVGISQPYFDNANGAFKQTMDTATQGLGVSQQGYNTGVSDLNAGRGYIPASTQSYDSQYSRFPDAAGAYLNPFIKGSLDVAAREAKTRFEQDALQRQAQRDSRSAFGGSRAVLVDSEANRNYNQNVDDLYVRGLSDAYTQAGNLFNQDESRLMGQFNAERDRDLQAANTFRQYGDTSSQMGSRAAGDSFNAANIFRNTGDSYVNAGKARNDVVNQTFGRLLQSGALQQEADQRTKDVDYESFISQRDYPQELLAQFASILNGSPSKGAQQNLQSPSIASQIGGSVVAGASLLSDRRTKTEVTKIGLHEIAGVGTIPTYRFRYAGDTTRKYHTGVMADEVEKLMPDAVHTGENGIKMVNYNAIGAAHLLSA